MMKFYELHKLKVKFGELYDKLDELRDEFESYMC